MSFGSKTKKPKEPVPQIVAQSGTASGVQYSETQVANAEAVPDQSTLLKQEDDDLLKKGVG